MQGKVIVVWGPHGSPGRTTLALNISCELVKAEQTVFLLDADCVAPSLSQYLALEEHSAGINAATRLVSQSRLDISQLTRLSRNLDCGKNSLSYLTGMPTPNRWSELLPDRIEEVIEVARENFEFVVIDIAAGLELGLTSNSTSADRNAATLTSLRMADQVITVCSADPIGVHRFLWALQDLQAMRLEAELITVVNRLRTSVLGSSAARQLSDTLSRLGQLTISAFIPEEAESFDIAIKTGQPVALGKRGSSARQAIATFVRGQLLNQRNHLDRVVAKLS